jgi:hypothetical protein
MRNFVQNRKPLMILIAGPYRSGTGGDPEKIAANLARLEEQALPLFQAGHIPMIGEWVALPIIKTAGSERAEEFLYPVAQRLLDCCDAVLRIPGASKGADQDVAIAEERGIPVYYKLEDVPR